MIISRTPFRISFFGGGAEQAKWYHSQGGSVLSASIDKYCYISCRILPPFFAHKTRLVYSQVENCMSTDEIQHPAVREILRFLKIDYGLEIHHDGDLPARSGMGSESSFTVGLLHALHAQSGIMPARRRLAVESIKIEHEVLDEAVGIEDQVCAAYGGFSRIDFSADGKFEVHPVSLSPSRLAEFNSHLMLFFAGPKQCDTGAIEAPPNRDELLAETQRLIGRGTALLESNEPINGFGELLHEAQQIEKRLTPGLWSDKIEKVYRRARRAGAIGGRYMGDAGGGFLLLVVPPCLREKVRGALPRNIHVPFRFESGGSQIIFYKCEREDYLQLHRQGVRRINGSSAEGGQRIRTLAAAKQGKRGDHSHNGDVVEGVGAER
ncbi:MAG: hypothetical protein JW720_01760 [Sedimentisphaerales bacterium]|nr:hypothetical protein [Sedimentisphaerales bacterium]